jgi:hypothetical protein
LVGGKNLKTKIYSFPYTAAMEKRAASSYQYLIALDENISRELKKPRGMKENKQELFGKR